MKAVIFHGWGSTSDDNWFPWLKRELEKKKIHVIIPDMPSTQNPKEKEWLKAAMDLTSYDENTVLIGHSLGTVIILRLLERLKKKIRAAFLVSAFDKNLGIPEIRDFFEREFYYPLIKSNSQKIYILNSDNDPYIPIGIAEGLARNLECRLVVFKGKGHLSAGTDDFMFPELREMILDEINKAD